MGEQPQTSGDIASGQTWTLPDASATDLEYEVTRVKSPVIGRDMNPMGRGDGAYYCNGGNLASDASTAIRGAKPDFTGEKAFGFGSSVNNLSFYDYYRVMKGIDIVCPVKMITCPVFYPPTGGDPCAGIDTTTLYGLCCLCLPRLCPECWPCDISTGCCYRKVQPWWNKICKPGQPVPPDGEGGIGDDNGGNGGGIGPEKPPPNGEPPPGDTPPPEQPKPPEEPPGVPPGGPPIGPGGPGGPGGGGGDSYGDYISEGECVKACQRGCDASCPYRGKEAPNKLMQCYWYCVSWCQNNQAESYQEAWKVGFDYCD